MKRPSFQFYPSDWLRDTALRTCSIGARGLWIDMICFMHEGNPYGHLKVNGKAVSDTQLSRMCGGEVIEVKKWLDELESSGVLSRDSDGCIFSRRMIRDEELREIRAAGGKEGGNPKLMGGYNKPGFVYAMLRASDGAVKIGISQDPPKRLYKIRAQFSGDEITIIGKNYVQDMGATEAELHKIFQSKKSGEWFALDEKEVKLLLDVHLKANQTPSSSSSSSSSTSFNSVPKGTGAKAPLTPDEIIFGYGVPLLTNAGTPEKQARTFLGGLRKSHGDGELVDALRECIRAKPLQPLEWLAKVLPPKGAPPKLNKQEALEASNRAVVKRLLEKDGHGIQ